VVEVQIPDLVIGAVSEGTVVGWQGASKSRPIYEVSFRGRQVKVAVTVSSNGFIVGANPVGQ
jgi:filamentous hemagglutinin